MQYVVETFKPEDISSPQKPLDTAGTCSDSPTLADFAAKKSENIEASGTKSTKANGMVPALSLPFKKSTLKSSDKDAQVAVDKLKKKKRVTINEEMNILEEFYRQSSIDS